MRGPLHQASAQVQVVKIDKFGGDAAPPSLGGSIARRYPRASRAGVRRASLVSAVMTGLTALLATEILVHR
jgi:hypothetical protein